MKESLLPLVLVRKDFLYLISEPLEMDEEDKRKAEEGTGSTPERKAQRQEGSLLQSFAKAPGIPAAMAEAKSAADAIAAVAGTQLTEDT